VTGVDQTKPALAPVSGSQITKGRYLSTDPGSREAVLNVSYARRNGLTVGKTIKLGGKTYDVVGLAQASLGGVLGALLGIGGAAAINAIGLTLKASVAAPSAPAGPGPGAGPGAGAAIAGTFGQGQVASGSTEVVLHAPVDAGLILLAISLALLGGLIAGSAGGLRAARLRPADALRHID